MDISNNFVPSDEQLKIFKFIEHGVGDAIVNACAGSGKSTTILQSLKYIPKNKSILFISFNKSIVTELIDKINSSNISHKGKIRILTFHGLGYRFFSNHFGKEPEINDKKYSEYVYKNIHTIAGEQYFNLRPCEQVLFKKNVISLIDYARQNLAQNEKEINLVAKKYGVPIIANEVYSTVRILRWGSENIDIVDFLDMVWLPTELNFFAKSYMSDFIFVDEAQDTSPVQQALIKRCFKRETRFIAVGDKYQTINAWCGSDQMAFEHIKDIHEGRTMSEFYLSTSYRCPKRLIEKAKEFAPNIYAKETAIDGEFNIVSDLSSIQPGDMVLCRNLSPLIKLHRKLTTSGHKAYIRNMGLDNTLNDIISISKCESTECLINNIEEYILSTWNAISKSLHCDLNECVTEPILVNLLEIYNIVKDLSVDFSTTTDMLEYLKTAFDQDDKDKSIMLSTIHRAKGLESDRVFVICPSLIPSPLAKQDWEIEAEKYLQYVMFTRAKKTLNMVDENQFKAGKWIGNELMMLNELRSIANIQELKKRS